MPRIGTYVTQADKDYLDGLPRGVSAAGILRGALQARRIDAGCPHDRSETVCLDCGATVEAEVPGSASLPA